MIYAIRCGSYVDAYYWLRKELEDHKNDLDIRTVDLRHLVVILKNGDAVHYVPESKFERWTLGREWIEIESLDELVKGQKNE